MPEWFLLKLNIGNKTRRLFCYLLFNVRFYYDSRILQINFEVINWKAATGVLSQNPPTCAHAFHDHCSSSAPPLWQAMIWV